MSTFVRRRRGAPPPTQTNEITPDTESSVALLWLQLFTTLRTTRLFHNLHFSLLSYFILVHFPPNLFQGLTDACIFFFYLDLPFRIAAFIKLHACRVRQGVTLSLTCQVLGIIARIRVSYHRSSVQQQPILAFKTKCTSSVYNAYQRAAHLYKASC